MSANKNKNLSTQALLEMDTIVSAMKEESKKTLGVLLTEAVKGALRESVEEEEEKKDYEVVDDNEKDDAKDTSKEASKKDVDEEGEDELEGMPQDGGQAGGMGQQMPQQQQGAGQEMPQGGEDPSMGAGQEAPEVGMVGDEQAPEQGEGGDEEGWDDLSQYQVGDSTYDLTGVKDLNVIKGVYKRLSDDDNIVVTKDGDMLHLSDNDAGTDYIIDLGEEGDEESPEQEPQGDMPMDGEGEMPNNLNEGDEFDIAGLPSGEEDDDDDLLNFETGDGFSDEEDEYSDGDSTDFNFELGDGEFSDDEFDSDGLEGPSGDLEGEMNNNMFESRKRKPMKESKEVLFEVDLGYTDNYQDKDPIKGLSNNEPSKSGKSWHKGVPTGTQKPWAGPSKPKGDPFGKTVDEEEEKCCPKCGKCGAECTCDKEIEEANLSQSRWNDTHANHNRVPAANEDEYRRQGMQKTSKGTEYRPVSSKNESKEVRAIKAENRELKKAVIELRKNLKEAYMTNVNLGKITKLFLENTTSKAEKIDIVNRFANEANTIDKSKALYESISRELNKKNNSNPMNINETSQTANGTKALNENSYKSQEVLKTIDFMNRVLNC